MHAQFDIFTWNMVLTGSERTSERGTMQPNKAQKMNRTKRKGQSEHAMNGIKAIVSSQMRLDAAVHVRYFEQMLGCALCTLFLLLRVKYAHIPIMNRSPII